MPRVLIYTELIEGRPSPASLIALAAAKKNAPLADITAVAVEHQTPCDPADFLGAGEAFIFKASSSGYTSETHLEAIVRSFKSLSPSLLLFPSSYAGLDLAPMAATKLSIPLMTSSLSFSLEPGEFEVYELEALCQAYGGRALASVKAALPAALILDPAASFLKASELSPPSNAQVFKLDSISDPAITFVELIEPPEDLLDISKSDIIVCVGRGLGDDFDRESTELVAELLGGVTAATRPVVDRELFDRSKQIGKSGKSVFPKVYLALGVSGAPEHLEGICGAPLIVAVNTDRQAPIFEAASIGVVADAGEFTSLLAEKLKQKI